jgi:hypothetical protein
MSRITHSEPVAAGFTSVAEAPAKSPREWLPIQLVLAAYACAWILVWIAVPASRQQFPLDDDWAFARGAFQFARGEGIHYQGWASIPLLGQWIWVTPWLWLWPNDWAALRLSTIALSGFGLVAFYDLLRQGKTPPAMAGFLSACLAFNPLFFLLSGTFLSDVPSLSFSLVALAAYGRALIASSPPARLPKPEGGTGTGTWLILAAFTALLAVSTRQNAVAAVLAAGTCWWSRGRPGNRWAWALAIAVPLLSLVSIQAWFARRPDVGPVLPGLFRPDVGFLLPFWVLHFAGLSAFGALLVAGGTDRLRIQVWLTLLMIAGAAYWVVYGFMLDYGRFFPYRLNLLTPWGALAGPAREPLYPGERPLIMSDGVRLALTVLGCIGAGALAARFITNRIDITSRQSLLWQFTLWQLPFLLLAPKIHDRYLLVLIPGVLAIAGYGVLQAGWHWRAGLAVCALMGLASMGLMHDWLSWNSAWWALGNRAVAHGIEGTDIEGGFEWDAWHNALDERKNKPSNFALHTIRDWFKYSRHAISFSPYADTVTEDSEMYGLWLRSGTWRIYLIRPTEPSTVGP